MKIIKITVEKLENDNIDPYPYLIFKTSHVGDQDIWQGQPAFLLGFAKEPKVGKIDLLFKKFWKKPKKAKGMYPVFRTSDERWYTETAKVIKVTVEKKEPTGNGIVKTKKISRGNGIVKTKKISRIILS